MVDIEKHIQQIDQYKNSINLLSTNYSLVFPMHSHEKGQFCYAEGGVTFFKDEQKTFLLPARHFMWIPPKVVHNIWHKQPTDSIYTFYVPPSAIPPVAFYDKIGIYPVTPLLLEMVHYARKWEGDLFPDSFEYRFLENILELLADLQQPSLPFSLPTSNSDKMNHVLHYIQDHLYLKLTLNKVGHEFGMSERTLSRNFQNLLKMSFFQYVKMARIIRAIELLLLEDGSISEVAFATGYESLASFSNTFQDLVGKRPSEFRKFQHSS